MARNCVDCFVAVNFGTFSEAVASRLYTVEEHVWVMPCYTPETAVLHVCCNHNTHEL